MNQAILSSKHWLLMLACCLIPLGLLGAVLVLKVDLGSFGLVAIMLLCPLLHIFLMRGMGHEHGQATPAGRACHEDTPQQAEATKTVARKSS